MPLSRFCLKNPIATTLFYVFVSLIGLTALLKMNRSILPPVSIPVVSISAPYPGVGPDEVERLIIEPIEDQLADLPDLSRISASAQNGIGQILVDFRFGSDVDANRANVQRAVDAARPNMPADLVPPIVSNDDPTQAPILEESISSQLVGARDLSDLVSRQVLPALRATSGVGSVLISGTIRRQFTVRPEPAPLYALRGTVLDVFRAVSAGNDMFGGGKLASPIRQATIAIDATVASKQQLEDLPAMIPNNAAVRIRDVADVRDDVADQNVIARVDGDPAIVVYISHAAGEDSMSTIAAARTTFSRLAERFPEVRFEELRTDVPYTQAAIYGVLQTLGEGIVLTVLVVLLFLHAVRNALISAIAIPTSLCAAFAAMWVSGFSINILSLMGLSLTMGILVDDSIVIIEAISRKAGLGLQPEAAALAGRSELGGVAVAITLVDVAVFAPIALMSGIVGEFMREFGLVIVFATSFSLLVSFTLTPLLAAKWALARRSDSLDGLSFHEVLAALKSQAKLFPWTFRTWFMLRVIALWHGRINALNAMEERLAKRCAFVWLPVAIRYRSLVLSLAFSLCVLSVVPLVAGAIPTEFSPPVNRGNVTLNVTLPAGTPLGVTDASMQRMSSALLDDPAVKHVEANAGRAFNGGTDIFASNVGQLRIILSDPSGNGDEVASNVLLLNRLVPDATIVGSGKGMGGTPAVSYNIGGDDKAIDVAANRIAATLRQNPFADDITVSNGGLEPRLQVNLDAQRASLLNVSPDDAAQSARIASGGSIATKLRLPSGLVDVVVQSSATESGQLEELKQFTVRSANGLLVPLGDIFRITFTHEPTVIQRENGQRVVTVSANPVDGEPISLVTAPVSRELRDPNFLPSGTHIEPRGDIEQFLDTVSKIFAAFVISLIAVYAVLAVLYQSYTLPLVIMLTVPLASIGAFGSLFVLNILRSVFPNSPLFQFQTLNLYSMLGIVLLIGLVSKNGILLVEFAERSVRGGRHAREAIQFAVQERFRPILMTTLAMIAGMLPLAIGHSIGAEYRRALGTVVIGGLSTSLLLTLFVVPAAYVAYRDRASYKKREAVPPNVPLPFSAASFSANP